MFPKAVRVVVELHMRAITCPGVHLAAKDDVYISVCLMHQYRNSECLPAVFPLLIREKMRFEKTLKYATDPAAIAEFLQCETVKVELIQLIRPSGKILASFEEDARSFLFPEPKLVPSFSGVERELLMTRHPSFPGISPRLEFSTKTTITELSNGDRLSVSASAMMRKSTRKGLQQDSVRHPSPAPQTHRELQHRDQPPFLGVLQLQTKDSWLGEKFSSQHSAIPDRSSRLGNLSPLNTQPSREAGNSRRSSSSPWLPHEDSSDTDDLLDFAEEVGQRHSLTGYEDSSSPSHSSMEHQRHSGSLIGSSNAWKEIQERVQNLLTSPKAVYRLACGATDSETDEVLKRRSIVPYSCPF